MTEKRKTPKPLTRSQIKEGLQTIPMDTLLLGVGTEARLTPKQREFARLVALGESKAGAYRQSYKSKGNTKTVANKGYQLTQRGDIQATVEAFAAAQRFAESHTPAQLRAFVVQQLTAHAANEENPPAVRINALKLLGTVSEVAAFTERKEVVNIKASGDIKERIAAKLKLIGAGTTFEHNSQQDNEQDADSLMAELDPTQTEAQEDDPTLPGTPLNRGVIVAEDVHIIPHNQTSSVLDQSERIQDDSDPMNEIDCDGSIYATDADMSDAVCGYHSIDQGLPDGSVAGKLSTKNVDNV
jgi:DNA-binding CsgD family transcriptional regulator